MEKQRLLLPPGETLDLTSNALQIALRLGTRGYDVELIDLRVSPGGEPFDAREVLPERWAVNGSHASPASWPETMQTPSGWVVAGIDNRGACRRACEKHPGHQLVDATSWMPGDAQWPMPLGQTGRVRLTDIRWPSVVRLSGLLECSCDSPCCASVETFPRSLLEPILQEMTHLSPATELLLDECSFFGSDGPDLARWLCEVAPGLRWRLVCGPRVDAKMATALPELGCIALCIQTPTPAQETFAVLVPGSDPDALVAEILAIPATLPVDLIYEVGGPGEVLATQRAGALRLRLIGAAVRSFRARPLSPGSAARFTASAKQPIEWTGRGPHGWSSGHINHAWRTKLARELQLAAESLGLKVIGKLPLSREFLRHREQIVSRLLDPHHGLPSIVGRNLPLVGVLHREKAFTGPEILEIDLTNDCNNTCVGCWCHSLMMGSDRFGGAFKKQFLATDVLLKLLDDAAASGTRVLQLAGSGEPFMHPDIIEVLEHAKKLELEVAVITNVNFITREWADRLVQIGVDHITASVWAGTPEMYVQTHPNQTEKSFERIRDVLTYLWQRKREQRRTRPQVKMYHVISSVNCREIIPMVDLAIETGCEQVEFQMVDVVAGKSELLALSPLDRVAVIEQFKELSLRAVDPTRTAARNTSLYDALDRGAEVRQFGKFEKPLHPGFVWADPLLETMTCPEGCEGSLSVEDFCDPTETRYYYFWSVWDCHRCARYDCCPVDKTHLALTKEFTELTGFGSFYRRLVSQQTAPQGGVHYEEALVDKVPCTVGWTYSRVRVSGHVIPCCKGHEHPLGSLHEQSFPQIWFGPTLDEFRRHAVAEKKSHPYFARIGCYKACDNIGMNLATEQQLEALSEENRETLRRASEEC